MIKKYFSIISIIIRLLLFFNLALPSPVMAAKIIFAIEYNQPPQTQPQSTLPNPPPPPPTANQNNIQNQPDQNQPYQTQGYNNYDASSSPIAFYAIIALLVIVVIVAIFAISMRGGRTANRNR